MRFLFFVFLLLLAMPKSTLFSQTLEHTPLQLESENPDSVAKRLLKYKDLLNKKYEPLFKTKEAKDVFIKEILAYNAYTFEAGTLYYNWIEAESYLNAITKQLLGNKMDSCIKVKVVRSPDDNAFMVEDGTVYVNVGMLANINTEAEIASTIGHEYGHYIDLHLYKSHLIYESSKTEQALFKGTLLGFGLKSATYSNLRSLEKDADKTAINLLIHSNYNPFAFVSDFKRYKLMEEKYKKSKHYRSSFFNDHPSSSARIADATIELKKADTLGKKDFIVSKDLFSKIKQIAIDETILLYLQELNYDAAIELCYRELLKHPTDEFYLFFMSESLRRLLTVHPKKTTDFFITAPYNIRAKNEKIKNKKPIVLSQKYPSLSGSTLSKQSGFLADLLLFYNENISVENFPRSPLSNMDTIEFVTNAEALFYFSSLQKKLGYTSRNFTVKLVNKKNLDSISPIHSNIAYLNNYNALFDQYKKYSSPDSSKKIDLIIYDIDAWVTRYVLVNKGVYEDYYSADLKKSINDVFYLPNKYNINYFAFDSLQQNNRNQFLFYTYGIFRNYTKPIKLRERGLFSVNSENIFPANPISVAPEITSLLGEKKQIATALVKLEFYYGAGYSTPKTTSMSLAGFYNSLSTPFYSKAIYTIATVHILDYKNERIIEKIFSIKSDNEELFYNDLRQINTAISNALNK